LVGAEVGVEVEEVARCCGWGDETGLTVVEGDLSNWGGGVGEAGGLLGGGMVAPGAYGVEVGEEVGGEVSGESFAIELFGEVGGEVLGHDDADEEGVAGLPGLGEVVEDVEFYG
jgi:hypothetical protein